MTHLAIIGGGIIGAATLEALSRQSSDWKLTLLEKEPTLAAHQSGRNSGVIHSGIYYPPGSLKARYCRRGKQLLEEFCRQNSIPFEIRGKLISAIEPGQVGALSRLAERAEQNGVACRAVSAEEARRLEPRLKSHGALEVPETGVVDYALVTRTLVQQAQQRGSQLWLDSEVLGINRRVEGIELNTTQGRLKVDGYLNCAGLFSDRIARKAGVNLSVSMVPFRGEYYRLAAASTSGLSGRLIYPLPDPKFPFLGVHLTPKLTGEVLVGPNAVLALAREGYRWGQINLSHIWQLLNFAGFLRLAATHWRFGLEEMNRSLNRARFAASLSQLVEGVRVQDLTAVPSGVRAQLVSNGGQLVDDFYIVDSPGGVHVLNAPSPAATASMKIGQDLAERAYQKFG